MLLRLIAGGRGELEATQDLCLDQSAEFWREYEDWWLEDEFSRRVISDIDRVKIGPGQSVLEAIKCSGMQPDHLSGSTHTLLLVKFTDTFLPMTRMGPNCYKYLFEVCRMADKRMALTGYCNPTDADMQGCPVLFENTGKIITTAREFLYEFVEVMNLID